MARLPLTLACNEYDRTRALEDGTVRPNGIELNYLRLTVEEIFFRMLRHREFDVAEMSFGSFVVSMESDDPPFIGIPVFTSRMFRHGGIFINTAAGINSPEDLRGRTVGVPEYQLSANIWIRGILADRHNVPVDAVRYRTGGQETPGRIEKAALHLPDNIAVSPIDPDQTLAQMLLDGEIDALYTPRMPRAFAQSDPRVGRLFDDTVSAEQEYYSATGIFPIMHLVAIRRDIYDANRWVAQSLYEAFEEARVIASDGLYDTSALRVMLPWLIQHVEDTRRVLGDNFWTYGFEANKHVLDTFLRYHHEQGLSRSQWQAKQLFAPETLDAPVII